MSNEKPLNYVRNGEAVSASITNRATIELEAMVRQLQSTVSAMGQGQSLWLRDQRLPPGLFVGSPVFLDNDGQIRGAMAKAYTENGAVFTSLSTQVCGVVGVKHSELVGDILLSGIAAMDISGAAGGTATPGVYELSTANPGRLRKGPTLNGVPVLQLTTNNRVILRPQLIDLGERHRHYSFQLIASPAGDHVPPTVGQPHVVTNPDAELPGWLPANHASFNGLAPVGAKFGYNLAADPAIAAAWPPVPVDAAHLQMTRFYVPGVDYYLPVDMSLLCKINNDGIWWMEDTYGTVPWWPSLDTSDTDPLPPESQTDLFLWFTRVTYGAENTVVSSLISADPRVQIGCAGNVGKTAAVGNLAIALNLEQGIASSQQSGHVALKTLQADGQFLAGPVLEGLYTQDSRIQLTSNASRLLNPGDVFSPTVHQGLVEIQLDQQDSLLVRPQVTRLEGATESYSPVLYLGLPVGRESGFVSRYDLPESLPATPKLRLNLLLLGQAVGTLPQLIVRYAVVPIPTTPGLPTPISVSYASLAIATNLTLSAAQQVILAQSGPISVAPRQLIMLQIQRVAGDSYTGEVGILRHDVSITST